MYARFGFVLRDRDTSSGIGSREGAKNGRVGAVNFGAGNDGTRRRGVLRGRGRPTSYNGTVGGIMAMEFGGNMRLPCCGSGFGLGRNSGIFISNGCCKDDKIIARIVAGFGVDEGRCGSIVTGLSLAMRNDFGGFRGFVVSAGNAATAERRILS